MRLTSIVSLVALGVTLSTAATLGCKRNEAAIEKEPPPPSPAELEKLATAGGETFNKTCIACHSIGAGDRTGPDLKDVHKRRDRAWLTKWLKDSIGMGQTDPVGKELLAKFKNIPMPNQNLTDQQINEVIAYFEVQSAKPAAAAPVVEKLADADFERAKGIYFNRCAGCHGTLRAGATGPNIQPARTTKLGTDTIKNILTNGTPGGMPAWGKAGILNDEEIGIVARFIQQEPPAPPSKGIDEIKASWKLTVAPDKRPTKVETTRNWQNFFGVVLRDAGKVAIIDGDTKELVGIVDTGFAVHILRASSSGRYFLAVGRDGKVTMIDLWTKQPTIVSQVQGCFDARSVDGSKMHGYEDKVIIEGCYWPPQYVIYDGQTLEPKKVVDVLGPAYDNGEELKEVRVAGIWAMHDEPLWLINLKESGHVGVVDYSKPDFPLVKRIAAERFLHDGGWDKSGRFLLVAANMKNTMAVIDAKEKKLVTKFETGVKPHPGRGANWLDPQYGWVNGTVHIGEPKLVIFGADPAKHPENAWKVLKKIDVPAAGGLFVKTHDKSPWVWFDSTLSSDEKGPKQICAYSKKDQKVEKCWSPTDHGRMVHFEYDKNGGEVWVSVWDKEGELIVYDDKTLTEKTRIKGPWMVTPTGKFNVWNTAHDVY